MKTNKVLFLDYDDVVNIPMWNEKGTRCKYNFPIDGKVNNFQAVQWVSEFCKKYHYNIVVSSSWRLDNNYKECLINAGLRDGIDILGCTDDLWDCYGPRRGNEIKKWLDEHPEIKYYIIFDDYDDFLPEQKEHWVKTNVGVGFTIKEYRIAQNIAERDRGRGGSF